jgi:hypothetical protein
MTLAELTEPYERQIRENQRKQLEAMRWMREHPNAHPDVAKGQYALVDALGEQNKRLGEQWDEARERWMSGRAAWTEQKKTGS